MTEHQYLHEAIRQLDPVRFSPFSSFRKVQHFQNNLEHLVYKLELSGAKVVLNKDQHFLRPKLGLLTLKMKDRLRKTFAKSLSLYRVRKYRNFTICGNLAIAEYAALHIDKKSIIKLHLRNRCSRVIVLIHSQDIVSTSEHANQIIEKNDWQSGYFVCGRSPMPPLDTNLVRHIKNLTVHIY